MSAGFFGWGQAEAIHQGARPRCVSVAPVPHECQPIGSVVVGNRPSFRQLLGECSVRPVSRSWSLGWSVVQCRAAGNIDPAAPGSWDVYGRRSGRRPVRGGRRRQAVTCNVEGRDVASFVGDAQAALARQVSFPAGTCPVFGGEAEARAETQQELLLHSGLAGIGIILLLTIVMRNLPNLLLVLVNLPFTLVVGVVAVYLTGGSISIGGLVGFVTLFGITTRHSIMLMSHYEHLVTSEAHRVQGPSPWSSDDDACHC